MGYRLWLPGDPEPGDDTSERMDAAITSVATPPAPVQQTPHEIFLTKVAPAFHRMSRRLEPVLADRWLGASEKIRRNAPAIYEAITRAEEQADEIARRFMAGKATEAQFLVAVADYEEAWRQGAAVVETVDATKSWRPPCAGCAADDVTVAVHLDDGTILCRRCMAGGGPREGSA